MEIHELNTFSGTPGSSDYFVTDNGSDTSKISASNLFGPLNERIDNIIAGPASSAQEVIDARLGDNEVTYNSLGEAIRSQVAILQSELDGNVKWKTIKDEYVSNMDGSIISYSGWDRSDYIYVGNYTYINVVSALASKYNAFYDENKNFISQFNINDYVRTIKVPANAKYMMVSNVALRLAATTITYDIINRTEYDALTAKDNDILFYTPDVFGGSLENIGPKLTVMSYNVAHYNNDTETYITDEKRFNFKKMISALKPDFIGTQEDEQYIDGSDNTKAALGYIYRPILPFVAGGTGSLIRSRMNYDTYGTLQYSNGRPLRYAIYTLNEKKVLVISTHLVAGTSAESISARLIQYTELFQWVNGEIQLSGTSCPAWDYCIITGDFNGETATDRTNLRTLASARGFTLANGGWLGWLETCRDSAGVYSVDNIIVSPNIVINSVTACKSLYYELYSDHYPLVAELTLTE